MTDSEFILFCKGLLLNQSNMNILSNNDSSRIYAMAGQYEIASKYLELCPGFGIHNDLLKDLLKDVEKFYDRHK